MTATSRESDFIAWMGKNFPSTKVFDERQTLFKRTERTGYRKIDFDQRIGVCIHQALVYAESWNAVSKYHTRRWDNAPGIAYTIGIDLDGSISVFWDFDVKCYSQGDAKTPGDENARWLGVVLNGKLKHKDVPDGGEPTVAQMLSVLAIIKYFHEKYNWRYTTGHFMLHKPACPGKTIETIVRAVRFNERAGDKDERDFHAFCAIDKNRQSLLKELDYYKGRIDGDWGTKSREAFMDFQAENGLGPDGIWNALTEAKMYEIVTDKGIFPK